MKFSPQFVIVVLLLVGGFMLFAYIRDQMAKAELRKRGVTVTARVTNRNRQIHTEHDAQNNRTTTSETYSVSYQYTVNGASYSGSENVDVGVYDALADGQPVEVVYLPENPAQARLASDL